jgi:hypothetical protein
LWEGRSRVIGIKGLTSTIVSAKLMEDDMVEGKRDWKYEGGGRFVGG